MTYGYIRVSSDKQTVENQRFEIDSFCQSQHMEVDEMVSSINVKKLWVIL